MKSRLFSTQNLGAAQAGSAPGNVRPMPREADSADDVVGVEIDTRLIEVFERVGDPGRPEDCVDLFLRNLGPTMTRQKGACRGLRRRTVSRDELWRLSAVRLLR